MSVFVAFEGGEGAGKSTQTRLLARRLSREGYEAVRTREPGGTGLGNAVRRWLKTHTDLTPWAELLLFSAARAQHVQEVITPALNAGQVVICDRFTASTVAYQGHGRGLTLELVNRLNEEATRGVAPDLTVLLDVDVEVGLARKEGGHVDAFESQGADFHHRVREGYHALASQEPERWLVLDGALNRAAIATLIWKRLQPLLQRKLG